MNIAIHSYAREKKRKRKGHRRKFWHDKYFSKRDEHKKEFSFELEIKVSL